MTASLEVMRARLSAAVVSAPPGLPAANELCLASVELFGVDGAALSMVYGGASWGTSGSSGETSRRLDEYQFTYGEGPCMAAVATQEPVLMPDLDSPHERRWPGFTGAVLNEGVRGVFALPIMITSACVGALDLFRGAPGPLEPDQLAGATMAARLASLTLLDLIADDTSARARVPEAPPPSAGQDAWERLADLDRLEIYQAQGMLISQLDVDPAEALVRLRAHAIATNQTASQVARDIVERRLELERDDGDGTARGLR